MRKLRFILPLMLIFLLALPVSAEHLPEKNILNRELIVEKDRNIVDDNIKGKVDVIVEYEDAIIRIFMSPKVYVKRVVLPAALIFASGLLAFAVVEVRRYLKSN